MKQILKTATALVMLLCLLMGAAMAETVKTEEELIAAVLPDATSLKKQSLKSKYKVFEDLGVENEVVAAWKAKNGFVIQTRVHYGVEFYENPTMNVFVGLDKDGLITGVAVGTTVDHTPAYLNTVTQEHLDASYVGKLASYSLTVDAVAGATISSDAVLYGVQAASWYAANVFRVGEREAQDIQIKKLQAVVPGTYEKLDVDASFTSETGTVQYAAKGTDAQGNAFYAVNVLASFTPADPANDMAMPTYQVWIREADGMVFMANMLAGHFYEAFPMDEARLQSYYGVAIKTGTEFDTFVDGLITDAPEYILTSATQAFPDTLTGATPQGNDTSLAVRNCFITAAQYYAQILAN